MLETIQERIARRDEHLQRLVKQAKLRSFRTSPRYKYGYKDPKNYKEVVAFDKRNKINKSKAANFLEHKQLAEYLRCLGDPVHNADYGWGDNDVIICDGSHKRMLITNRHRKCQYRLYQFREGWRNRNG